MKIEELPHIEINRVKIDCRETSRWCYSEFDRKFVIKNHYLPKFDAMADSYQIISKVLDIDCVVAYITDKSQTTFLIKTSRQYVGFICLSKKLTPYLCGHSARTITRISSWRKKDEFIDFTKDEDLIIVDKDKWNKYIKTKLLDSLSNG